ncbi:MAG TPA: hypothetical protein VMG62_01855, partial [Solirubrobacteraceae bacterium]|nr:hypothetical protein [Solirubrobacteraceae bacterium]
MVVPTVREEALSGFLDAWRDELRNATIVVVQDGPECSFAVTGENVRHLSWDDIEIELGDEAWIIPRGSGCVRSFGCWIAHRLEP